ncbi:hypothetical protein N7532_003801 [Penicillium argentinense]|uniref:DUF7730 domain-containing protein n=1 Tax=Penicillium argentinense TaxID=1131581 RepID=A0A9W9FN70_9EURO|nr:uncharacterized protein N7532_003801 [Penicillium argentinense]KAJ5103272.1 hypothetical protein N7532_003801 [Penicillium argentinense]
MARIKQGVFSWEDVLAQRYQSNKPPSLPRRRRTSPTPQPQPQCRLLSQLSPELRLMIWELALGGLRLHIIQRSPQRLGHIVCPLSTATAEQPRTRRAGEVFCEICNGGGIPQPAREGDLARAGRDADGNLLALALTCRQISLESTRLLYTLNTFEFSTPWTLPYLRPTLPLEYWEGIRSVELRWAFPGHWLPTKDPVRTVYVSAGRAQWVETCRALMRLPALQSFVLVLGSSWFSEPAEKLPVFLEPLRGLRVQRPRRCGWEKLPLHTGSGSGSGSGSELRGSSGSSASITRIRAETIGLRSPVSCVCVRPLVSTGVVTDGVSSRTLPMKEEARPTWELRLQGQPYYLHELGRVGGDLRRRGIDCAISMK